MSVYQICSDQPSLIPQMSCFITSQIIWGCTTFLDNVSDYVCVRLMIDLSLSETLLSKEALEKLMAKSRQTIKHYHSDNGRFADNGFTDSINQKDQNITFCGVGSHHQNGIVENNNKILTTGASTLLLHGMRMWPQMINKIFWPFAMKTISEKLNSLQIYHKGRTPESILYGVNVEKFQSNHFTYSPAQYMC